MKKSIFAIYALSGLSAFASPYEASVKNLTALLQSKGLQDEIGSSSRITSVQEAYYNGLRYRVEAKATMSNDKTCVIAIAEPTRAGEGTNFSFARCER